MSDLSFLNLGLAQTTLHPLNLEVESASGSRIRLRNGKEIIDFISGIGVSSFGHSNPVILHALREQLDRHLHVMVYGEFHQESQTLAAKRLLNFLPDELDSVYFVNSGAEAIDGALKLARRATMKTKIVAFQGSYHGNTLGALSVSSNEQRKRPFEPLLPDIEFIPWNQISTLDVIDENTAAVILETVQGDAGVRIPDPTWMKNLRMRCTQVGALLILDEIQCGMGRTGRPFAFEHYNVIPDILCLGKALGGGMPVGAFVAKKSMMQLLAQNPALGHITTFGGHPMPCAGAAGALQVMSELNWESLEGCALKFQQRMISQSLVKEVRRLGAFIAVELKNEEAVDFCVKKALEKGLLIFYFLSTPQAFRVAPPLTMHPEDWEEATNILLETFDEWERIHSSTA